MSTARHAERVPGLHLRVARMERGLAQRDVARQLGVSPRRISSLEGAAFVPRNAADRYFDALGRLVTVEARVAELRSAERAGRRAVMPLPHRPEDPDQAPVAKPGGSPRESTAAVGPRALDRLG